MERTIEGPYTLVLELIEELKPKWCRTEEFIDELKKLTMKPELTIDEIFGV